MPLTKQRLERLIRHRRRLEREQEAALGVVLGRRRERARALDASRALRVRSVADEALRATVDTTRREAGVAYLRRADREIGARRSALEQSAREVDEARLEMVRLRRDRMALETLADRLARQEKRRRARRETLALDEAAGRAWIVANQRTHNAPGGDR